MKKNIILKLKYILPLLILLLISAKNAQAAMDINNIPAESLALFNPLEGSGIDFSGTPSEIAVGFIGLIVKGVLRLVAGIAIIFIIIGGIMYMFSSGNEESMTRARKIVIYAIIGVALSVGGAIILSEIAIALGATDNSIFAISDNIRILTDPSGGAKKITENVINLLLTSLAMIGVIGIVIGGIWYMTSGGNEEKMELGKKTLIYSIIGLAIAIGSLVIVEQVISIVQSP